MYLRKYFPIFAKKAYINSCSQGALSYQVKNAYRQFMNDWQELGSPWELWVTKSEGVRAQFAALINAAPDEVAVVTSASAGVNALASALDFSGQRNKVIVDDYAFPTTAQIWHAQEPRGAEVVHLREQGSFIPTAAWEAAIDEQTLLVNLTHVCYRHGGVPDVAAIVEIAHRKGALVLLDSFQAAGTMPINVKASGVDFLVSGALKYLCASAGIAWLYASQGLINSLTPTDSGWFAQADIFAMDIYGNDPSPTARRFESGTPPVVNVYAAEAGLKLIEQVGIHAIDQQRRELTEAIKSLAKLHGFTVATPARHGAMIAIRAHDVEKLVGLLAADDIIVSSRDGNLRISPHFYNTLDDIERLFAGLRQHKQLLV